MEVRPGIIVKVKDGRGRVHVRRAVTGVEPGDQFPIVWVVREEEWAAAAGAGREVEGPMPWPAEDVSPDDETADRRGGAA